MPLIAALKTTPIGLRRARMALHVMICAGAALSSVSAPPARAGELPATVTAPKGINLGSTSFFDGFGRTTEGWTWLQYGRDETLTRITDDRGDTNPLFKGTDIHAYVAQTQLSYTSDWHPFGGDAIGLSALLPLIDFSSHFAQNSPVKLANNGFGIGDISFGPFYQSKYSMDEGRPVFAWRAQLCVTAPTGSLDKRVSINQGSGFWALNPLVAFTWLPLPQIEISGRVNYQYNFATSTLQNPPPIPGLVYRTGQAGQMVYGNFDASYAVQDGVYVGVNGYALEQTSQDLTNGQKVPHSRETELSVGPGGRYVFDASNALNVNLYLPAVSRNATSGTQFTFQFIHRF